MTAPLREVIQLIPGPDGSSAMAQAFQFVPFSSADLVNWKAANPSYSESPRQLTELCESIMSSHNPTWSDCRQLLMTLFSREERTRIRDEAIKILKGRMPATETETSWLATRCPESDPKWDYNREDQMQKLKDYQQLLIDAMKAGMKKPVNLSKPGEVRQEPTETPDHFYDRLLEAYQRYTPLEITDPANQRLINMAFVTQSCPDIKRKLQRQEGFAGMPISFLLELARRVYNNRDEQERKDRDLRAQKKSQFLAAAITQAASSGQGNAGTREKGFRRARYDECINCYQTTHRIANCPFALRADLANKQRFQNGKGRPKDRQGHNPGGQVRQGVYTPHPRQQNQASAPPPPPPPPLSPDAGTFYPQEIVGVAEMDHWDVPE